MRSSDRSYAVALHENIGSITAWRASLSDKDRSRLVSPQSNVKRWRTATGQRCSRQCDLRADAMKHWRRFLSVMRALPQGQAEQLWQQSLFEMAQP
jgi:hypothetical protein